MRARLLLPDGSVRELVVEGGDASLIGREPSAEALAPIAGAPAQVRIETADAVGVSASHTAMWETAARAYVVDLGSRNGTWLKLPPRVPVALDAPAELCLGLGLAITTRPEEPALHDARWATAAEFPAAVAAAVKAWLDALGEDAAVSVTRDVGEAPGAIPLPRGLRLQIRPVRTVDVHWLARLATLWRYVDEQVRVFEAEERSREEGLVLAAEPSREAHRRVVEAAARGQRLMLLGPSGAGKEDLARAYHRHGARSGPFIALNCGELSREMVRAELFGAEEGSFTGSVKKIVGAVERAHGGTLFLDEIGEMPIDVQPVLLRFLDRGEYSRLGGYGTVLRSDVRIVCATNRDLREAMQHGRFRQDLWFRLSIQVVEVRPLDERFDDVLAYLRDRELDGISVFHALAPAALEVLRHHRWDGNFRELGNFVERLPRASRAHELDEAACRRALASGAIRSAAAPPPERAPPASNGERWSAWSTTAIEAFVADHRGRAPATWDEVQELLEKYVKPLLMVRLGLGDEVVPRDPEALPRLARRLAEIVRADRGTALKQLARFVERFAPAG